MQLTRSFFKWKRIAVASVALLSLTMTWSYNPAYADSTSGWGLIQTTAGKVKEAVHTKDGGFALLQATNKEFILTKTSSEGAIEWIRTLTPELPTNPNFERYFSENSNCSLQEAQDGGFVITGTDDWYKLTDFFMVTTDADGHYLDTKILSTNRTSSLQSLRMTEDGGYILMAQTERNMVSEVMVKKFNSSGDLIWESYRRPYNQMGQNPTLQLTQDGGYVISGYSKGNWGEPTNYTTTKLDSSGQEMWNRSNLEVFPSGSRVIETPDHNLIDVQISGHTLKASKIDQNDHVLWSTDIKTGIDITIEDVQLTKAGDLFIGGNIQAAHEVDNEYVTLLKAEGSSAWFKYIGGPWTEEKLKQIIPLSNTEFATYGTWEGEGYLVKLNAPVQTPDPGDSEVALKLDSNEYSLVPGDTLDTRLIVQDQQGGSKDVTSQGKYMIDDTNIAQVDEAGNITGVRPGETKLNASYQDQTVTAKIYVFKSAVNGLKLDSDEYSLLPGESLDAHLSVKDGTGTKDVTLKGTYSIENTKVAVVDSEGNITAVQQGETVLTASYQGVEVKAKVIVY
ncbi:Bacterial Ig-like domain (group 2) [compost metagenome]